MNLNWSINAVEATKNICCAKSEGVDNQNTVTKSIKRLNNQIWSDGPKTMDSEAML